MEETKNFLYDIIESDLAEGRVESVCTRFPPEPNGYLHIGSAKAIYINYTAAKKFSGRFNLRYDDTNPAKEDDEYVRSIREDIEWLGASPDGVFYGSDYFDKCYEYAVLLIKKGLAYVCDLSGDELREYRGTLTEPGRESPYRNRSVEENLELFERMKNGEFADGLAYASGKDRYEQPQYEYARSCHIPYQARCTPPPGREMVHLSALRFCTSDTGRARGRYSFHVLD